ncbi:MAG: ribonuclease HI [Deltaproteobacteria bacterium]|nr:ribonuclease HI [Deltaproteobacteria bacterium]
MEVQIYTDGSCLGNPGPGGWAALLIKGGREKLISGGKKETTNNQMELTAVIKSLSALRRPCNVEVYSDSQYVVKGMKHWVHNWKKNNWKTAAKKPVSNQELWEKLCKVAEKHEITWHWVKAHSGHPENERVDEAAREEAMASAGN